MPKIKRLIIENFRSIKTLDMKFDDFNAFIGRNNVGKSNIMDAIKLMLDEKWPAYHIREEDICKYNNGEECSIKILFTDAVQHPSYSIPIYGLSLSFNKHAGPLFICLGESGTPLITNNEKYVFPSKELRKEIPIVYIGIQRDLNYALSSKYTDNVLHKIFEICKQELELDEDKKVKFKSAIKAVNEVAKTERVKEFQKVFGDEVKRIIGVADIEINLNDPDLLEFYKSMPLFVKEADGYEYAPALDMGTGIQSSLVIALIKAYNSISTSSIILAIEEPEIYLHPHARRYFYNSLLEFSRSGTQVIYTTHSPELVGMNIPGAINIVRKSIEKGTYVQQGLNLLVDEEGPLKLYTRFNSDRNELFFAEKVVLVEGATEQKSLPIAFELNGIDIDKSNISIVDSGGADGIPFLVKILKVFEIPFVVIADSDSHNPEKQKIEKRNKNLKQLCGPDRVFFLEPDFEGAFGIENSKNKIMNAVKKLGSVSSKEELPEEINKAIKKLFEM